MRRAPWLMSAALGFLGCSSELILVLSPEAANVATGSWLKLTATASPTCGYVTPTARTCHPAGADPDVARVELDGGALFRFDEARSTGNVAFLYAFDEGSTQVIVTAQRDAQEDSSAHVYSVVTPNQVTVLAHCAGDERAQPLDARPIRAGRTVPLVIGLRRGDVTLTSLGYDRLVVSAGELHVELVDGGPTGHFFIAPDAGGPVQLTAPDVPGFAATLSVWSDEQIAQVDGGVRFCR